MRKVAITLSLLASAICFFVMLTSTSMITPSHAAVLGIDFGSEFIKVASVKPGTPFHIVVDEQSKRKIPSIVAFDNGERHFGNGAVQLAMRKPKDTYIWAQRLLGKDINSPQVEELRRQGYPWEIIELPERRSLGFRHTRARNANESDVVFTVEEIVAMSLQHVMKIAEADAESIVKDCVITVPPYWTHRERQAMIDAAEIAGLNVLSLVNENTAAAIQYGIDRKYDANETHTVLFYNMGSTSTKATLATYNSYVRKERGGKNKTLGQVEVRGTGYDESLGGSSFETRITEFVVGEVDKKFAAKGKQDFTIRSNPKAMAKIRSASEKAKTVLSANQESQIFLNSLYEDTDFQFMLTREQFLTMTSDLIERVTKPIQQVLDETGVKLEEIDAVVIIGGGVRIPAIQSAIKNFVAKDQLTQNLNGDEAMVMGAVFRAANLSATFQVRQFGVLDESPYSVGVRIMSHDAPTNNAASEELQVDDETEGEKPTSTDSSSTGSGTSFSKRASLFKRHNRLQKKKSVQFTYTDDFECLISHELTKSNVLPSGIPLPIAHYNITGLSRLGETQRYADLLKEQKPRVSLSFLLDASGTTNLVSAEATLEETIKVPKPKPVKKEEETVPVTEEKKEGDSETATETKKEVETQATEEEKKETTESADTEVEYTFKKKTLSIPLSVVKTGAPGSIDSMNDVAMGHARATLERLRRADDLKKEIAAAKNTLEAYIYSTRSQLHEPEVEQVSTEEQREAVRVALGEAEEWLYDQGEDSATIFKDKLASLKALSDPIFFRRAELSAFPVALNTTLETIQFVRKQLVDYTKNRPWISEVERERLRNKVDDLEEWLKEKQAAQAKLTAFEVPVLESEMLYERLKPIHKLSTEMSKLKKPADKPKVKTTKGEKKKKKKDEKGEDEKSEESTSTSEETKETKEGKEGKEGEKSTETEEPPIDDTVATKVEEEELKKDEL